MKDPDMRSHSGGCRKKDVLLTGPFKPTTPDLTTPAASVKHRLTGLTGLQVPG